MKKVNRLYQNFQPSHYELHLTIHPKTLKFNGLVIITGQKIGRPSKRFTFHQHELKITKATIHKIDKNYCDPIEITRINHHQKFDEVRLHSSQQLFSGQYELSLTFSGNITQQLNGIYPSTYKEAGEIKQLLVTQFESHHAREAFPCIDEPEAKATFSLTLNTPNKGIVISNTSVSQQSIQRNLRQTTFDITPKMSTYLLAFIFGELSFIEAKTKKGTIVRTYATKDQVPHTKFALKVAVDCLDFYENYFGIDYPLAKCDLIALPDFASGAMENWGCITFREQALLVDVNNTSLPLKQHVALVIAHELAHQWFGNLVTMRWWTDLWLNEGFASWMEYLAIDSLFPEWNMWVEFTNSEQEAGLRLDALESTHPIEVAIHHPDEIRTIFDNISYSKGASVLLMLYKYLGADNFRKGLQHYLHKFAYSNTDTNDLWTELEQAANKPVKSFMDSWTSKPGFPIVQVIKQKNILNVHQQRFLFTANHKVNQVLWPIPLLGSPAVTSELLQSVDKSFDVAANTTVLLNKERGGFYRVTYSSEILQKLSLMIEQNQMTVINRLGLLSDAFEASKAGYAPTVDALDLLKSFQNEDNVFVWEMIASSLGSIRMTMDDEKLRDLMKPFENTLSQQQLQRLDWQPTTKHESHFDTLLRPLILGLAAIADNILVISEAQKRFDQMKRSEDNSPDIRGVIYTTAARHGNKKTFDKLLKLHNQSNNSEERVTLSAALTAFKQPDLIAKSLDIIKTSDVRLQDAAYWLVYSFNNYLAKDQTWEWFKNNWDWLETNLGNDLSFSRFPIYAARVFSNATFLRDYDKFFGKHRSPSLDRSIEQGREIIEWQSQWRTKDLSTIKQFFKDQSI